MAVYETSLWKKGYTYICGVDEVGRGPLAGPVTAAAVILPIGTKRNGISDSKLLTPKKREELADHIKGIAIAWAIESVDHETIDEINILQASLLAMRRAVLRLSARIDLLLVDGRQAVPDLPSEQRPIVGGDGVSVAIGAASIIAKVERDRMMTEYNHEFPGYRFDRNKGYPTREHRLALHARGPCTIHRKTFKLISDDVIQEALRF
jgi:ribonuclease HII